MIITFILSLCLALLQSQGISNPPAGPGIRSLSWLAGCWEDRRADRVVTEHWMLPSGSDMIGGSTTASRDSTLEIEFLRIHEGKRGSLNYIASPSGQKTTSFSLVSYSSNELVFENLKHDFPQRIIYKRDGDSLLTARVEGLHKGKEFAFSFSMRRILCGGEVPDTTK